MGVPRTEWVFEELGAAAVRRGSNEAQLFKTSQVDEDEYAGTDGLVREVIQNSLDAAVGNGPVRLRLALHGKEDLPKPARLKNYFSRLEAALKNPQF